MPDLQPSNMQAQGDQPLQQPAPARAQLPRLRGAPQPPPAEPAIDVGAFHVAPSALVIRPGERARVTVTLRNEASRVCREQLALDISGRSVVLQPDLKSAADGNPRLPSYVILPAPGFC